MIDFRSDTVTKATPEMLQAMTSAAVGDDVFEDDPTVNALEEKAAKLFGMEAALFCPSGTMTNQIAIKVHTQPGQEVICHELSHIYNYEGGGIAFNSGCSVRLLRGDQGRFTSEMVEEAINPDDPHFPISSLVSIENTCNKGGGVTWDLSEIASISATARDAGLKMHLDGARLFNALVATGHSPKDYGLNFDTISICLSKGLGCPIGSLLLGDKTMMKQARRVRKVFGGGMRQAGYVAAAGIFALEIHIERLAEDHSKAKMLADGLVDCSWIERVLEPETNIVVAELKEGKHQNDFLEVLSRKNILAVNFGKGKVRFVTHLDISSNQIDETLNVFRSI
ncbi:MAG: aminotransferase class I/II-fold pyridoxal phosphate-dependent enzyme [Flavobacteriales bacterium]|jgi:threonine aldolase|nr:aminotransferase class I/II-fold pyridoxal phosphate-dependent enzyme [Flavobacteriales bacterium]NCG29133.1 aminotransferase class I/II-fold pyridoxal phosphate-dependent enzyme [Bacteroidota bacterium]MBT3963499.1 aminotransferase class I/II-fold pyridoxal phosphate-dependent enzyme [Flavobacteriales bacterium]MBT4705668.1 aminotransferase class I/II-fold pyridoxal phosphate-dependent enzyme [Flavobacteriales bacterium]MBT4930944.1 aminotransferase class I/II-fold pyridoxal phosphate-depen